MLLMQTHTHARSRTTSIKKDTHFWSENARALHCYEYSIFSWSTGIYQLYHVIKCSSSRSLYMSDKHIKSTIRIALYTKHAYYSFTHTHTKRTKIKIKIAGEHIKNAVCAIRQAKRAQMYCMCTAYAVEGKKQAATE